MLNKQHLEDKEYISMFFIFQKVGIQKKSSKKFGTFI